MDRQNREEDPSALVVRQGHSRSRVIQSSYKDLVPSRSDYTDTDLARPSQEAIDAETAKTQEALDKLVEKKLAEGQQWSTPASVTSARDGATYIRYKSNSIFQTDGQPMERIIKIVDKQNDPMLPLKNKIVRTPQRPPSPPAPILHDTSKKLTAQDHKDWYIPPAISNWKNQKGFTIAIDKRMSYLKTDEDHTINDRFADLNEALQKAEEDAREEIKLKNEVRAKLAERENQERELKLRSLAEQTRGSHDSGGRDGRDDHDGYSTDYRSARARELAREERRRKAEREIKLSRMSAGQKLRRDDVPERVIRTVTQRQGASDGPDFDSRLYQQSADAHATYDGELFAQDGARNAIYGDEEDGGLSGPVAFEKDEDQAAKNKRMAAAPAPDGAESGPKRPRHDLG